MGYEIAPQAMRRVLQMLTGYNGNLLNVSEISRSLGVSSTTVQRYLDILEGSFLIRRLQPYDVNVGKRLVKSPKFYFRDSGMFHLLSGISSQSQLMGHRCFGASWEAYALEQICRALPERWEPYFYRTHSGAEADLVLKSAQGNLYGIEIKYSLSHKISRGFTESADDVQAAQKFLVIASGSVFPKSGAVQVAGLKHFLAVILPDFV